MTASEFAEEIPLHTSSELASSNGMEQHMNTRHNQRTRRAITAIAALGLVTFGAACSGEDLAESMIERQVESETGENFDIDLNGGNCVSMQTDEGSITCDENGNMVIESPDGSAVVNMDDAGNIQMTGDNGEEVNIATDADGNTVINSPEGSVVANIDADGTYEVTSEDGSYSATTGSELPAEFPSDIAIPAGFTITTSTVMGDASMKIVALTLTTTSSVQEAVAALSASLEAAGYTQNSSTDAGDSVFAAHSKGESEVVTTYSLDGDGATVVGISVQGPG